MSIQSSGLMLSPQGSLLQVVLKEFLRGLKSQNRTPELERDFPDLQGLLLSKIQQLKNVIPVPKEDAYQHGGTLRLSFENFLAPLGNVLGCIPGINHQWSVFHNRLPVKCRMIRGDQHAVQ
jgi:hypothetical protein